MTFNPCAVIPSHDHWTALPGVVAAARGQGLAVFIIDDGSGEPAAAAIASLHRPAAGVTVVRLPDNRGKGGAVCEGFRLAAEAGFTHVVQIDADGQHDLDALPELLAQARARPKALVSGEPVYDATMPWGRRIGRWITHLWVFVETLSFSITDSMCGLRVYPLAAVTELLAGEGVGAGMDFDTDIMVRLFWRKVEPVMVPVRVTYPPGNSSNFHMVRDNWKITRMHTRLVLTMLVRRLTGATAPPRHWAGLAERGALWGLRFVVAAHRLLGRRGCMAVMAPIVLYFYLTGAEQRRASQRFLGRALGRQPGRLDGLRHFMDFAGRALDAFAAWSGTLPPVAVTCDTPDAFARIAADRRGALLVVSHLGNVELSRALMAPALRQRLTLLAHTRHAENYGRLLREFRPEAAARVIQVTDIGPATAITLQEAIERGEWLSIAGDRVPVLSKDRVVPVPFLGKSAEFSEGPWLLAGLLG